MEVWMFPVLCLLLGCIMMCARLSEIEEKLLSEIEEKMKALEGLDGAA